VADQPALRNRVAVRIRNTLRQTKGSVMQLYLAMHEAAPDEGGTRVLGVFSTLDRAKLRHEEAGPKLPWMEMQGIGRRWWEVGVGGDQFIYAIDLDESL
jgi:hypothetical protein